MLVVCIRMYPYVPYVTCMLLVCYSYVTRMYSCGVVVMIIKIEHSVCDILKKKKKKNQGRLCSEHRD